jgi:glycosyltransferase involved in cell wall biosynthesis
MKVSIIIACYNHGKFLTQSVKSALNQDYPNLEIVIANDGSTDNSLEVANSFKGDSRVVVISTENQGVVATRNQAIWLSSGDYILPLDADDYLASDDVGSEMFKIFRRILNLT